MEFSVASQTLVFLQAAVLGVVLSFFYDLLRVLRKAFKFRGLLTGVLDVFFCLVATASVFLFILLYTDGQLRFYIFLGAALGAALYFLTVSCAFVTLALRVFRFFQNIFSGTASALEKSLLDTVDTTQKAVAHLKTRRKAENKKKKLKIQKKLFNFFVKYRKM